MRIQQGELTIRGAELRDADQLNRWWNDGRVMAHAGLLNGLGEPQEQVVTLVRRNETQLSQVCIIECTGIPIGETNYQIGEGLAEIGSRSANSNTRIADWARSSCGR